MRLNDCKNFRGIQHNTCVAEVNMRELSGTTSGMITRIPCLASHKESHCIHCHKFTPITQEDIDENNREFNEYLENVLPLIIKLKSELTEKHGGKNKGGAGFIECPICSNKLSWAISAINGHMILRCKTENCINVIE